MISVILPIYHVEEYIKQCVYSLINQTYKDIEIICINDCGLDNSITLVKELQKKDSRIRLINHDENRGLGGARNTGIKAARGEYITFIDSDDYCDKTMLEKLYKSINDLNADAAVCGVMLSFEADHTQKKHTAFHYDDLADLTLYDISKSKEILTDMWPSAWNKLYKTEIIRKFNILFKERILYEDHTFFYEYFSHCNTFSYIDEPLYFYRQQRPNSITTQSVGREQEIFTILNYIQSIFKNIYDKKTQELLFRKIAVRLLYERRWVFNQSDLNYYKYLYAVSDYLKKWTKDELFEAKDVFIQNNDPLFYSHEQIAALEKRNYIHPPKQPILKRLIKKTPLAQKYIRIKGIIGKYKDDFYWYIPKIYDRQDNLERMIYQYENNQEHLSALSLNEKKLTEINENLKLFDKRFSELEKKIHLSKTKLDEAWWLSWNIKDSISQMQTDSPESSECLLRYYPTWIPCEFPKYFQGNTWYWADNFKKFYLLNHDTVQKDLDELYDGFSEADKVFLNTLWERNVKILPLSKYTAENMYLLKTDALFSNDELEEQRRIFRTYNKCIEAYILPTNEVYEIPVFYYHHGLKKLSRQLLNKIADGDILDLGGFIGDSALILSQYTNRKVFTVELNQTNLQKMEMVLKTNHITDKVVPINCAVGNEDTIHKYYGDSSFSTLYSQNADLYKEQDNICVYKVDTLVHNYKISPNFIKLDVEGAEYETILGAKETICKLKPVLCISIYHTAKDFLYIKPLIESWNLGYSFHIENHNPFDPVYEKMLICIPDNL